MMINTYVRTFYSEGFSSLVMSHYNTNFSLCFNRWVEKDSRGMEVFDTTNGLSTTLNYEDASLLFQVAMSILNGENAENEIKAVLQCNNATLTFDCKKEENNQMVAYLTIDKNNQSISFKFSDFQYQIKQNGQIVTKVIQAGVGALAEILHGYLSGIGTERHLVKLADYYASSKDENQQKSYVEIGSSGGHQNGSW